MKISLEWLEEFLPGVGAVGAEKCAAALMNGGLPVESIERVGNDFVLDVEVTSNRSDCLSHIGVARELGALLGMGGRRHEGIEARRHEGEDKVTPSFEVENLAPGLCSYYSARVIRGVKVGASPQWLVRRLEAVGIRSINNVVDVTNYVLMELGQPLHAFDLDRLAGQKIVVRKASKGEKLISIDGKTRELTSEMLVIADGQKPVALAGVMGGKESEVGAGTVNILLESARFDSMSVRKTSRALALRSDSSYRFERGIDPAMAERASVRAMELILQLAGGAGDGFGVQGSAKSDSKRVVLRLSKLQSVLGISVSAEEAMDALSRLGFSPVRTGESIEATVPSWRLDVSIEVDLVEEVARLIGYSRIAVREAIEIRLTPPQLDLRAIDRMRGAMVASGYFEALTFSWVTDGLRDDFRPAEAAGLLRAHESVRKDHAHLRPSLLAGLLEAVRRNETVGNGAVKLFEIGGTFWTDAAGKVDERRRLGLVGSADYREVRGAVENLLEALDASRSVKITPGERPGFAKAACGIVEWGGAAIGWIGKIDRAVLENLGLKEAVAACELELAPLIAGAQWQPQVKELGKFPAVKRDLSLVVADRIRYEAIDSLVRELKLPNLDGVEYVTTYRGKQIGEGNKSVTIALVFRSDAATLTSEEVEGSVLRVVEAAKAQVGATLRI